MPAVDKLPGRTSPRLLAYTAPVTQFEGWVAFDGRHNSLAAGGFRVDPSLAGDTIARLAQTMSRKQAFLGLGVDGAKCGLACPPDAAHIDGVASRFLRFLRPHLLERFSMGPEMGTTWGWVESLARRQGLSSVKIAIARAQGLTEQEFHRRHRLLAEPLGGATLGARRAGHALAHACVATPAWLGRPAQGRRVTRPRLRHARPGGSARARRCGLFSGGDRRRERLPRGTGRARRRRAAPHAAWAHRRPGGRRGPDRPSQEVLRVGADALVLAACEDAVGGDEVADVAASSSAVVVGANLGLSPTVEDALHERGVVVLPVTSPREGARHR